MPRLNELDRRVLRELFAADAPTQGELAAKFGVAPTAIAKALNKLVDADLIVLKRDGQRMIPKLAIAEAFARLMASFRPLLEATS
jgi:DNA-binding MarR family transcriptional regulator